MNYFNSKTVKEFKWVNIKKNFIRRWADLTFDMRVVPKYTIGVTAMFLHVLAAFVVSMFMLSIGNVFVFTCKKTAPIFEWLSEKLFSVIYK